MCTINFAEPNWAIIKFESKAHLTLNLEKPFSLSLRMTLKSSMRTITVTEKRHCAVMKLYKNRDLLHFLITVKTKLFQTLFFLLLSIYIFSNKVFKFGIMTCTKA